MPCTTEDITIHAVSTFFVSNEFYSFCFSSVYLQTDIEFWNTYTMFSVFTGYNQTNCVSFIDCNGTWNKLKLFCFDFEFLYFTTRYNSLFWLTNFHTIF